MSENYGKAMKNVVVGEDCVVRVDGGSEFEPYSILDGHKSKKEGLFKTKLLSSADREEFFYKTSGILFACPVSSAFPNESFYGEADQKLCLGLEGLTLARVFIPSMRDKKNKWTTYCDCILTEDGTVICKSEPSSLKNDADEILADFDRMGWNFGRIGWNSGRDRYRLFFSDEIYSQIAKTVAVATVEECGIQKGEEEFSTAKSLPAKIFKADPKFVGEVLTEVENVLSNKLRKVKKDDATQIAKVVGVGERISTGLKQIFKDKLEEAKDLEFSTFCTEPEKLFPEGTFEHSEEKIHNI